jgi:hypothetical protein
VCHAHKLSIGQLSWETRGYWGELGEWEIGNARSPASHIEVVGRPRALGAEPAAVERCGPRVFICRGEGRGVKSEARVAASQLLCFCY